MDYSNFIISKEQAENIASQIVNDISAYINNHKQEYELWLEKDYNKRMVV